MEYGLLEYEIKNNEIVITECAYNAVDVQIPKYIENKKVTSIGDSAFYFCEALENIVIPNSVTSVGDCAFLNCESLTSAVIPNSVTDIGTNAFSGCTSLTSITIPDSVTSIGSYAFKDCTSLTSVTISDAITSIGEYAFFNTAYYNDRSNWENNVLYIDNYLISGRYEKYNKETDRYDIFAVSGEYSIKQGTTVIASMAFKDCIFLKGITIPDDIVNIDYGVFGNCTSLTNITIPDSVTNIGNYAFENCELLTSVTIPDSVIKMGSHIFHNCTLLTKITIGNSVTSIGEDVFYNTAYYNDRSNWENNVLYIDNYLISGRYEKYNKETDRYDIFAVSGEYSIKQGTTVIASMAFKDCIFLKGITIPDDIVNIDYGVFGNCTSLTNITIPDSVIRIGDSAFYNCTSLKKIEGRFNKLPPKVDFLNLLEQLNKECCCKIDNVV